MRPISDLPKIDGLKFVGITNDGARLACHVFVARGGVIECRAPFIAGRDDIREDLKGWEAVKPTKKAFRDHLNRLHADTPNHRHNRYQQRTRPYGDYLYAQDRDKFNVEFTEWAASLLQHHQESVT